MNAECFIDTNILVYTFDAEHAEKRTRAQAIVQSALRTGNGVISFQVVQEFLNVATRKFQEPMTPPAALRYLDRVLDPLCTVMSSIALYERTLDLQERWRFGFYDSLIVGAALEARCATLYSEDLQHGQKIETLSVVNPFL